MDREGKGGSNRVKKKWERQRETVMERKRARAGARRKREWEVVKVEKSASSKREGGEHHNTHYDTSYTEVAICYLSQYADPHHDYSRHTGYSNSTESMCN